LFRGKSGFFLPENGLRRPAVYRRLNGFFRIAFPPESLNVLGATAVQTPAPTHFALSTNGIWPSNAFHFLGLISTPWRAFYAFPQRAGVQQNVFYSLLPLLVNRKKAYFACFGVKRLRRQ